MRDRTLRGRRIPFRVYLTLATAGLIFLTSAIILLDVYRQSQTAAKADAEEAYKQVADGVGRQFDSLLRDNSGWVEFSAKQRGMLVPIDAADMDHPAFDTLLGLVRKNPSVYSAYIGHTDGGFLQAIGILENPAIVKALDAPPQGTDHARRIVAVAGNERVERWLFFDYIGQPLGSRETTAAIYDPRTRPWYSGAFDINLPFLTAPYIFNSTKALGITIAHSLPSARGVFGIDLTLDGLSGFLAQQAFSPTGRIYLYDNAFRLWAASTTGKTQLLDDVRESPDPDVRRLSQMSGAANVPALQASRTADGTMLDYVVQLVAPSGSRLSIAITAPLTDFTGHLPSRMNRIFLAAIFVLIFAMPLAFFLATYLSQALKRLAGEAERLQHFDFTSGTLQSSAIREVDSLSRSFDLMRSALHARTIDLSTAQSRLEKLVELGIRLSSERDSINLMEYILRGAKELCNADGGSLYLRTDNDTLRFTTMLTDSLSVFMGGTSGKEITQPPIPMHDPATGAPNHHNVASYAAICGEPINIPDAYKAEGFDFLGTKQFDQKTGYRSTSFLTVPMKNRQGRVIGVLQLLNAIDQNTGGVIPFAKDIEGFVMALATQAAVALENSILLEQQKALLNSFIQVIASAIDAKSPYTGGHCARVPQVAKWLAEAACASQAEPFREFKLSDDDWYEFHIGAWLHDCGKVTTPEYVVDKATKLETINNRIHEIRTRFEVLIRDAQIDYWQGVAEGSDPIALAQQRDVRLAQIRDNFAFIAKANVGSEYMDVEHKERVKAIARQTWLRHLDDRIGLSQDEEERYARIPAPVLPAIEPLLSDRLDHIIERDDGGKPWGDNPYRFKMDVPQHLYNRGEVYNLCIERGTLTKEERFKINDHIVQTIILLEQLPFPKHLARVPEIAGGHHETMIGTGYPCKLKKVDLSLASRIMAIADIFEALTASDRPYKKAKTLSEALRILSTMRDEQHIDPDLFDLFLTAEVHQKYAEIFLPPSQVDAVNIADYLSGKQPAA